LLSATWLKSAELAAAAAPETITTLQIVAAIISFRRDGMPQLYEVTSQDGAKARLGISEFPAQQSFSCKGWNVRILLVEDDKAIGEPLQRALERDGYEVTWVASGAAALSAEPTDLVLLDLGLPDMDGLDVCKKLRANSATPVIVITARGEEIDRVLGLELGADDYVVKPFGSRELIARIRAVTRRTNATPPDANAPTDAGGADAENVQRLGALTLDRRSHRVLLRDAELVLTPKEYDLLAILAEDPGALRTRGEIIDQVWDSHWYGPTKTLDVHIASLRKKLGDTAWIETVRGVGFRLRPIE
jgi:two-component system, OmpR family, response regulator RegX3